MTINNNKNAKLSKSTKKTKSTKSNKLTKSTKSIKSKKLNESSNSNDVIFQVTDWNTYHEEVDFGDETLKKFVISMYGITKDNKKIYVKVKDYTPYFYIGIPPSWGSAQSKKALILINTIKSEVKKKNPDLVNSLKSWDLVDRCIFWKFTNYKKFPFIRLIFHSHEGFRAFERVLRWPIRSMILNPRPIKYKMYESNIEPMLRFMHIRKINSVGWIKIKGGKYNHYSDKNNPSTNDISIYTNWANIHPIKSNDISPLVIASFDIECTSGDGSFPQANRDEDKVIQIGTTFSRYGEDECFYKHIVTLGSCDKIDGVDVESYDNEVAVLISWTKMIVRMNPDIMTGYYIFGFDYKYLAERAKKLGCYTSFSKLGRTRNEISEFKTKDLSSSALGKNFLHYYIMTGRIQVDLLKVVQRDYKLGSYKLDDVAAEFIKETIKKLCIDVELNTTTIYTSNIYGLDVGRSIKLFENDGMADTFYKNGHKFKVIDIELKTKEINNVKCVSFTVDGIVEEKELDFVKNKVFWAQAKDAVSPADIFRLQKGSSADRAIVARYCIQDCVLVSKLMNKLQVLTNNIGMANVCHVPLSYIFLRGQSIKVFSLVSKKCRERNHVIPVIKKPWKGNNSKFKFQKKEVVEEEEDVGYEGATVFVPETGVHEDPVVVLDYSSLYPRSMIQKNMSHETLLENKKYNNLPTYHYEDATYLSKNGEIVNCRYAKAKDGSLAIIPEILQELLDARADTRKQQKTEKNPFAWKVLEGLQLAYKITANSVYGQTGAPTSPIYCKDIAASTTSTGRELLNVARIFTDIIFKIIVDSIQNDTYEEYVYKMNLLFDKKLDKFLGKRNIKELKKIKEDDKFPRYKYLEVFTKQNRDIIDDSKFKNGKVAFIKLIHDKITKLLEGKIINPKTIYGDTDSVFTKLQIANKDTPNIILTEDVSRELSITLGLICSDIINKILPWPHNLEYEKTFHPFIILTKKRYVGNKYEFNPYKYYQASMGIVLKRRDNSPIVKIVVGGIVKCILNDRSIEKALIYTKKTLKDILCDRYELDKFVITKTLKGNALTRSERVLEAKKPKEDRTYKERTRIVHAVLADRIADRDPGNKPSSNDRIPYAFVITDGPCKLQGDRVETPSYICANDLKLDYLYYITNQIMKPSMQFLQHMTDDPKRIFEQCIIKEMNRRHGKRPLNYYFNLIGDVDFDIEDPFGDVKNDEDEEDEIDSNNSFKMTSFYDDIVAVTNDAKNKVKKPTKKRIKQVKNTKSVYDKKAGGFVLDM
jgi:DNA polymerase elongation subunit (family B)